MAAKARARRIKMVLTDVEGTLTYVCRKNGGQGAFREFVEFIIAAQKKWDTITSRFKFIFDRKI